MVLPNESPLDDRPGSPAETLPPTDAPPVVEGFAAAAASGLPEQERPSIGDKDQNGQRQHQRQKSGYRRRADARRRGRVEDRGVVRCRGMCYCGGFRFFRYL